MVTSLQRSEKLSFLKRLNSVPWLKISAGKVFEALVHQRLEQGGTFSFGKPLEPGDSIPAGSTFRIRAGEEFRSLGELNGSLHSKYSRMMFPGRKDIYFKPIAPNLASIDSFLVSRQHGMPILIQITIADTHEIKTQGINDVWDAIPADSKRDGRLLFVASERSRLNSVQRHTGAVRKGPWKSCLKQRILYITDKDLCQGG